MRVLGLAEPGLTFTPNGRGQRLRGSAGAGLFRVSPCPEAAVSSPALRLPGPCPMSRPVAGFAGGPRRRQDGRACRLADAEPVSGAARSDRVLPIGLLLEIGQHVAVPDGGTDATTGRSRSVQPPVHSRRSARDEVAVQDGRPGSTGPPKPFRDTCDRGPVHVGSIPARGQGDGPTAHLERFAVLWRPWVDRLSRHGRGTQSWQRPGSGRNGVRRATGSRFNRRTAS